VARVAARIALDHVFVLCAEGAPEAEALLRLGLREGSGNRHPGQGTANRRFFFRNAYVELVWVAEPEEAGAEAVRPTRLFERWSRRGKDACPFGIVLRPAEGRSGDAPPFDAFAYRPRYLPPGAAIDIARDTPLCEPGLFYMGFARAPDASRNEPVDHAIPGREVTGLKVRVSCRERRSGSAARLEAAGLLSYEEGDDWLLEVTLDGGASTEADLRPALPLLFRW
jgi:hypothetical protein